MQRKGRKLRKCTFGNRQASTASNEATTGTRRKGGKKAKVQPPQKKNSGQGAALVLKVSLSPLPPTKKNNFFLSLYCIIMSHYPI
jgi:hypothetical protein